MVLIAIETMQRSCLTTVLEVRQFAAQMIDQELKGGQAHL
jgi:hypothetical protein